MTFKENAFICDSFAPATDFWLSSSFGGHPIVSFPLIKLKLNCCQGNQIGIIYVIIRQNIAIFFLAVYRQKCSPIFFCFNFNNYLKKNFFHYKFSDPNFAKLLQVHIDYDLKAVGVEPGEVKSSR